MRDKLEYAVSRLGRNLGNINDWMYGGLPSRWGVKSWRFVDRIAGRLYTYGER